MLTRYPVSEFGDPRLRLGDRYGLDNGQFTDRSLLRLVQGSWCSVTSHVPSGPATWNVQGAVSRRAAACHISRRLDETDHCSSLAEIVDPTQQ